MIKMNEAKIYENISDYIDGDMNQSELVEFEKVLSENKELNRLYGLPSKVVHCKRCLMHNQKPYSQNETTHISSTKKSVLGINEDGLCEACRYADIKKNID